MSSQPNNNDPLSSPPSFFSLSLSLVFRFENGLFPPFPSTIRIGLGRSGERRPQCQQQQMPEIGKELRGGVGADQIRRPLLPQFNIRLFPPPLSLYSFHAESSRVVLRCGAHLPLSTHRTTSEISRGSPLIALPTLDAIKSRQLGKSRRKKKKQLALHADSKKRRRKKTSSCNRGGKRSQSRNAQRPIVSILEEMISHCMYSMV